MTEWQKRCGQWSDHGVVDTLEDLDRFIRELKADPCTKYWVGELLGRIEGNADPVDMIHGLSMCLELAKRRYNTLQDMWGAAEAERDGEEEYYNAYDGSMRCWECGHII